MNTTPASIRREASANDAARALNAAYSTNRTARTTGDSTDKWVSDTATTCARLAVERFARVAGIDYAAAVAEAETLRPNVGVLTLPVHGV